MKTLPFMCVESMCLRIHSGSCLEGPLRNGNIDFTLYLKVEFPFLVILSLVGEKLLYKAYTNSEGVDEPAPCAL